MMNYETRVARSGRSLAERGVGALLVTNPTNVRYLTGFSGTNGQVLITSRGATFFTDPRYRARASALVQSAEVVIYGDKLTDVLAGHVADGKLGIEAADVSIAQRDALAGALEGVELEPLRGVVEELRRVKEPEEIALIKQAVAIADEAFEWVLERLTPGAVERDVALDLEVRMRTNGAAGISFEPIVGSGPLSAHIHHTPTDRQFEKGDFVLLDFGCKVDGYCSDLTRTVTIGPASEEQRKIYETVLEAQARGIGAVAPKAAGVAVDAAARAYIEECGHGDDFGHGLGHGVGLDVHEAPRLHRTSEDSLVAGDVVTVEPGIYVAGTGGVRIEDCVLVTPDGSEVLGRAPKDMLTEL
jgi:Xaa-Pro aminopeptidase